MRALAQSPRSSVATAPRRVLAWLAALALLAHAWLPLLQLQRPALAATPSPWGLALCHSGTAPASPDHQERRPGEAAICSFCCALQANGPLVMPAAIPLRAPAARPATAAREPTVPRTVASIGSAAQPRGPPSA